MSKIITKQVTVSRIRLTTVSKGVMVGIMAGSHEWGGAECLVNHGISNGVRLPPCKRCIYCHAWIRPDNMSWPCPGRMGATPPEPEQKTRFPEGAEL